MDDKKEPRKYECKLCNLTVLCITDLNRHIMGHKHKTCLKKSYPEMIPSLKSLQHFLDTYAKDAPLLGLEYIVEVQVGNYKYKCELCGCLENDRIFIVDHIIGSAHMTNYLRRHHPEVADYVKQRQNKLERKDAFYSSALQIQSMYGRKKIQETKTENEENDTSVSSGIDLSGEPSSSQEKKPEAPLECPNSKHPKSKHLKSMHLKSMHLKSMHPRRRKYSERKYVQREKALTFKSNDAFLQYLRGFVIENDEDAIFLKNMIYNCGNALTTFQEEQRSELMMLQREQAKAQGSSLAFRRH